MPPRRLSAPNLNQMSTITALHGGMNHPAAIQTTAVFPEFTPSTSYDKVPITNWSHFKPLRRFWEYLVLVISLITPISITYVILFDQHISVQRYSIFFVCDLIQIIDNFVILKTPFLRQGILVNGKIDIIKHYGVASFVIHVIASLPIGWIGIIKEDIVLYGVLSINRLLRLHQCWRTNKFIQQSQAYRGAISKMFPHLLFFAFVVHVFACIFFLIAHIEGIDNSWLQEYIQRGFSTSQLYAVCIYFVLTTILTIGFGDLHPTTSTERIICIFLELTGVAYEVLTISRIVQLIINPNRSNFVNSAQTLQEYLLKKKISKKYRNHVSHYNQMVWDSTHGAPPWETLFHGLPTSIKSSVTYEFCDKALSEMPLFYGMRQNFFLKFIESMNAFTFIPGEIIYQEGDSNFDLYIFKSGVIQMINNGQSYMTQETSNYVDGEKEFLFKIKRKQSLVALTFVEGWKASREVFAELINSDHRWRKHLFINARHLYPDYISSMNLKEDSLWQKENIPIKHEPSLHIFQPEEENDMHLGPRLSDESF